MYSRTRIMTHKFVGQKCIIRTYSAGVFFGELSEMISDKAGFISNCVRIWSWEKACSISQIAVDGLGGNSKLAIPVPQIYFSEIIELIPCSNKAINCIESMKKWQIDEDGNLVD